MFNVINEHIKHSIVGIEINASHIRKVYEGMVYGRATLMARSRKLLIWEIRITDSRNKLVCLAKLTVMVIEKINDEQR